MEEQTGREGVREEREGEWKEATDVQTEREGGER